MATASSEADLLRESTRGYLARHAPLSAVRAGLERPRSAAGWREAAEMGWLAAFVDEAHGGLGVRLPDAAVIAEELGRALYGGPFLGCALALSALPDLEGVLDGTRVAAWCAADALAGTQHVLDADLADVLVVSTPERTYVLPAEGFEAVPGLDLTRGLATVRLDGAEPLAVVEGGDPERVRAIGALLACADAVGAASRLLELTVEYAKQRVVFGRTLASYQAVKHRCADMLCWLEGSRVATAHAAEALQAVAVAKAYVGEHCARLAGEALQIHGGIGFTWEHDLHLHLRRIKADEALFGTPATHYAALASRHAE